VELTGFQAAGVISFAMTDYRMSSPPQEPPVLRFTSRRQFLRVAGCAIAMPAFAWAVNDVPTSLDHILLGCSDLDRGIAFVEQRTGIRAAFGGVHPGRGTQNALLSLGTRRYLEIIAPTPSNPVLRNTP
jgi:Glyoxalase-like domain